MPSEIPANLRRHLFETHEMVERRQEEVVAFMQSLLVSVEDPDEPFGQGDIVALQLTADLVAWARAIIEGETLFALRKIILAHRRVKVDGRHYSRFGGFLPDVLVSVFGPSLSPPLVAAWSNAFWMLVKCMGAEEIERVEDLRTPLSAGVHGHA